MGLFDGLAKIFTKNKEIADMLDFDFVTDASSRAYLKRMALESVLNFVSRTMSTMQVKIRNETGVTKKSWEYILNVRPNKDMSASEFWQKVIYRLMNDNEVLIVVSDDDQLLIAEDFYREETALYEDVFKGVTLKGFTFKRNFKMSEVIYLEYNNEELERFTDGLFRDYGELFGRIVEVSMRNNQIRASVSIEQTGTYNDEKDSSGKTQTEKLQGFIDRMYKSFKDRSIAIVPKLKGFEYEEYTNKIGNSNQSLEELDKMKKSLINDVSRMIGVPSALVHGEMADLKFNLEAYRKLCILPLIQKIESELTNKILEKEEYLNGERVKVQNVLKRDPFEFAVQIDKVVSSRVFTPNQVLEEFEYERSDDPVMDERVMTKNYETVKEGENTDGNTD